MSYTITNETKCTITIDSENSIKTFDEFTKIEDYSEFFSFNKNDFSISCTPFNLYQETMEEVSKILHDVGVKEAWGEIYDLRSDDENFPILVIKFL